MEREEVERGKDPGKKLSTVRFFLGERLLRSASSYIVRFTRVRVRPAMRLLSSNSWRALEAGTSAIAIKVHRWKPIRAKCCSLGSVRARAAPSRRGIRRAKAESAIDRAVRARNRRSAFKSAAFLDPLISVYRPRVHHKQLRRGLIPPQASIHACTNPRPCHALQKREICVVE